MSYDEEQLWRPAFGRLGIRVGVGNVFPEGARGRTFQNI